MSHTIDLAKMTPEEFFESLGRSGSISSELAVNVIWLLQKKIHVIIDRGHFDVEQHGNLRLVGDTFNLFVATARGFPRPLITDEQMIAKLVACGFTNEGARWSLVVERQNKNQSPSFVWSLDDSTNAHTHRLTIDGEHAADVWLYDGSDQPAVREATVTIVGVRGYIGDARMEGKSLDDLKHMVESIAFLLRRPL